MHQYSAYELTIRSVFELPELPTVDEIAEGADVEFRRGRVEPVPETEDEFGGRRIAATPTTCRLTYESLGSFLVEDGSRVVFDPSTSDALKRDATRRLFENEMLGLVLHQRGHLVLHASAVSVNGRAAVFLGPRGAGKSTTAAAFDAMGYPVLEDDVVAVRFDAAEPTVIPGIPQLRLRPDAAEALGVESVATPSTDSWYDKRILQVDDLPDAAPVAACYVLQDGDELTLDRISGPDRLLELISRTYARGLLSDTDQSAVHFEQCSQLSETALFRALARPQNHRALADLVDLVVDDLRTSPAVE